MGTGECSFDDFFHGSVTVGERGQVVIPAEARKKHRIETGDKMLVFSHPSGNAVILAKVESLQELTRMFATALTLIELELGESAEPKK